MMSRLLARLRSWGNGGAIANARIAAEARSREDEVVAALAARLRVAEHGQSPAAA
jgi:hypothetical protein